MDQNKFSFKSKNLVVDWISFKFQHLDNSTQIKIAKYLFKIGFNSYEEFGKLAKAFKKAIEFNSNNKSEVLFVKEAPYWKGTILNFSGSNARFFTVLLKKELFLGKFFLQEFLVDLISITREITK